MARSRHGLINVRLIWIIANVTNLAHQLADSGAGMESQDTNTAGLSAAILGGCMISFLGFGFAATFGVFLAPMTAELGWGREIFSLSVAVQALVWGFSQPIAGAIADRFGTARVLAFGAIAPAMG